MSERLADGRRWGRLGLVKAVQARFRELHGSKLASAVTLSIFLSLLPLLVVGVAVLGFISAGSSHDLAPRVIDNLGLTRSDLNESLTNAIQIAEHSRRTASVVGLVGLLWTGLGLVGALQYVWNTAWQVPGRGGLRDRLTGLGWLVGAGVLFSGSFALSALGRWLPWFAAVPGVLAGFVIGVGLWLWTAKVLPNRDVGWRPLLPGALLAATGFEILKIVGAYWLPRAVASSSALYGSIGAVIAVLVWLLVFGRVIVYAAMLEVVVWERRHGTVRIPIDVPARPGVAPLRANRAGEQELVRTGPGRLVASLTLRRGRDGKAVQPTVSAPEPKSEPAET